MDQQIASRRHDSRSIGGLIESMSLIKHDCFSIDDCLALRGDALRVAQWEASVAKAMRLRNNPEATRKADGEKLRSRAIKAFAQFTDYPPVTLEIPKRVWRRCYQLVRMCANPADWTSKTGPVIGASDDTMRVTFGVQRPSREFALLRAWGLIVPHNARGNGHRRYKVSASHNKTSGWSLAPIVLMLDSLDELRETERNLIEKHRLLCSEITNITSSIRSLMRPIANELAWAENTMSAQQTICARRRNLAVRITPKAISELEILHRQSLALHQAAEKQLSENSGEAFTDNPAATEMCSRVNQNVQYHTTTHKEHKFNGSSEGSERGGRDKTSANNQEDSYGLIRSGFKWTDIEKVFPFIRGFIHSHAGPNARLLHDICKMSAVSTETAIFAAKLLGPEAAIICALLTGERLSQGTIHSSPDKYMQSLVRRSAQGECNLGHSLYARCKAVNFERGR
ncbi:hypothetical protein D6851_15650 [Altericroceibacterium spongiae]|uniref:Uncharacterized protein n=1 Tax=Altericroceibacterium spongiae TaxID=2320269 RepID=A0A420EAL9_9SPHN|nr:hypothetical protein [Altericroceibacterium spongiae]RKF17694.1 hypothetical protein D6851_15650 [Altericroceibacterium spongiae]